MITVSISVNGSTIIARSAANLSPPGTEGFNDYHCDDGRRIIHNPEDGAVALAMKMLKGVKEPGSDTK